MAVIGSFFPKTIEGMGKGGSNPILNNANEYLNWKIGNNNLFTLSANKYRVWTTRYYSRNSENIVKNKISKVCALPDLAM